MRKNNSLIVGVAFATAMLTGAVVPVGGAQASPVYFEDFNSGFQGGTFLDQTGSADPHPNQTDRYDPSFFYSINNAGGWTFSGSTYFALGNGATPETSTNGAIYLNEPTGAGTTVVGLDITKTYTLSFTYWGDNRPGEEYSLFVTVNGVLKDTIIDTVLAAGANPGTVVTIPGLTTDGAGNLTLLFTQGTSHEASPIFDNVTISETPIPAALPLFATGLGAFGLLGWRRKRKNAAARAAA